jgi:CelD/BcsL family acetyltransferase involved in cellulose biosynthesis
MTEPLEHVFLDPSAEPWLAFAASQSQANIFHHEAWTRLLSKCYGYRPFVIALRDSDGVVRAGLPMMETGGRLTGRRWTSLPFTDHCSPLHSDAEWNARLAECLAGVARDPHTPEIELRWEYSGHPDLHMSSRHVLHTVALSSDVDAVLHSVARTHRRNISTAEKRGIRIERGTRPKDVDTFYRLHTQTRRRLGVPVQPKRFFDLLGSEVIDRGLGFVLLAYADAECVAGAVFLHWNQTLTYKFGASSASHLHMRPNNLLLWTAIRWGCENDYAVFDMGRTDLANEGLRSFKSGWGAKEAPLVYSSSSAQSQHQAVDTLMPLMHAVIRNSPLWVCRATGELLYKHVG